MGFLGNILGGIFKVILSPLINFIFSLLYGVLVRGPLLLLNYVDHAFQYVSGSQVDKLLFSTSLTDGHSTMNFFASSSPLKMFFLIVLGVSATCLALFAGIIIVTAATKGKAHPLKKMGRMALSSSIIFAIPLGFLIALSLSGSIMSAISGQHINMSQSNVQTFTQVTEQRINRIADSPGNAKKSFDGDNPISGMKDNSKVPADISYSLNDIYSNFQDDKNWVPDSSIREIAKASQDDYKTLKDLVVTYDGSQFSLRTELQNKFNDIKGIISNIKPNIKNEQMADKVKELQDYLQAIQNANEKFVDDSENLLTYKGSAQNTTNTALQNFQNAFNTIYGTDSDSQLQNLNTITNLKELAQEVGYLISGDLSSPDSGLTSLRQHLTDFAENTLVVTFYQVATGNRDSNWDRSIGSFNNDGFMLLVGSVLICVACVIMVLAVLWAMCRIFDLALLFIVSPGIVLFSAADDGARMKTWMNLVFAKLISIFGIVITLRLFGTLNTIFREGLDASSTFDGNSGYITKLILTGMFGIAGMLTAYKSSQTLSSIVGAGYGIAEGLQGRQMLSILKGGTGIAKSLALGGGTAIGLRTASSGSYGGGGGSSLGAMSNRGPIGRIADTWKDRAKSVTDKATKYSLGAIGSDRSKSDRINRVRTKQFERSASKQMKDIDKKGYKDNINNWKSRKDRHKK